MPGRDPAVASKAAAGRPWAAMAFLVAVGLQVASVAGIRDTTIGTSIIISPMTLFGLPTSTDAAWGPVSKYHLSIKIGAFISLTEGER